jgi:hypothetical protein
MKLAVLASALALAASPAHASTSESFFQAEVGLGASRASDVDGVWTQHNVKDNHERLITPTYLAGLTGSIYSRSRWSLRYHLDYVYIGEQRANCACVSDADYAAHNYGAATTGFAGSGHVQGVAFTLEPGYTWLGTRLAVEAGPFLFWNTWNEAVYTTPQIHISADRGARVGYVLGARIESHNLSLSARYYTHLQRSSLTYPGLVRNLYSLTLQYRF